jgi:four helix bundle protein
MNKIQKFEDLKCWQAARGMVKEVYEISETGKLAKDFDTKSQIKRAALSSMNNIAEGFGRYSNKDFIRFLNTAQSSVQEVQSILYVLTDLDYVDPDRIQRIRLQADESKNLILGFIKYLNTKL